MKARCSVMGCDEPVRCKELCRVHYERMRRWGTPWRTHRSWDAHPGERLLARLDFPETGCWIWQGSKTKYGYALVVVDKKNMYGHRLSYELFRGPIPKGYVIDHLCRVTSCVNPDHLEAVTNSENALRAAPYNTTRTKRPSRWCRNKHVRTPENTKVTADGHRCLICLEAKAAKRRNAAA